MSSSTNSGPASAAGSTPRRCRGIAPRVVALVLAAVVLLGSGAAGLAVRLISITDSSPATGSARVIAQGIAPLLGEEVVWRAVVYRARPRAEALTATRPLGFLVASGGPLLLSNDDPDTEEEDLTPEARLAPGEALLVRDGTEQQRASVTDENTEYIALELVRAAEASDIGSGELLFVSAPFTVGSTDTDHDLDLVSAVLGDGDTTTIPDVGQSVAILATDGAIDVIPSGGRRRTLQPGEGDVFSGELEVRPSTGGTGVAAGNAKRLIATQAAPNGGATFVAAVVGPEIPPEDAPVPTETASPTAAPVIAPSTESVTIEPPTEAPLPTEAPPTAPVEPTLEPALEPTLEPTLVPEPTRPPEADSDGDGLMDSVERQYGADPRNRDTDGDRLSDGEEVFTYGTSPTNANTDGDQCTDGEEALEGLGDPLDPTDCFFIT